ncbi:MAG TPA: YbfB/YjiJ family MFS transporter [Acetobacteraceae bacterium]|nr:YbfB/YjiJ family MFS transporter [Acetobacteraceae bacterium]
MDRADFPIWRTAFSGLLAMLAALGVARFGFAPLIPALTTAHWVSAPAAFDLGTLNLFGYLIGAAMARHRRLVIPVRAGIIGLMALTTLSMLACAINLGFWWFAPWRLISGITGGLLMVLMGQAVVARAPAAKRGVVGGLTFAGMGSGLTLSGFLIPFLLRAGLPAAWLALGGICGLATLIVILILPPERMPPAPPVPASMRARPGRAVLWLSIAYGLCAIGFVPYILFWSNFIALGLGRGVAAGSAYAALMGVAAALGPPLAGRMADRFGFGPTLAACYLLMALSVALPLGFTGPAALAVSSVGAGAIAMATVILTSGRVAELVPPSAVAASWGAATLAYSITQAAAAAGFSFLFRETGSYAPLFGIAALALLGASFLTFRTAREALAVA